ncbi:MAG: transferase hexapeptide repeat containing protein [Planctomycetaceae bacterium]|jgi:hypothetical protein|nr:transferase hexapeptide repeat containing protein [Planctomycetaceae bacterium]
MSTMEERLSALEAELQAVKRQLERLAKPRTWLDQVAGSMAPWPEFQEVLRLGREFRQAENNTSGKAAEGA